MTTRTGTTCSLLLAACALLAACSIMPSVADRVGLGTARPEVSLDRLRALSVVGSAPAADDQQVDQADVDARVKLADTVADYVVESLGAFLESVDPQAAPDAHTALRDRVAAEVSAAVLRRAEPEAQWSDRSGVRFVLYEVNREEVDRLVVEKLGLALARYSPQPGAAEQWGPALDQFLQDRARQQRLAAAQAAPAVAEEAEKPGPPEWIQTGRHPDYPPDRFFTAVGAGSDPESAMQSARAELGGALGQRLGDLLAALKTSSAATSLQQNVLALGGAPLGFRDDDLVAAKTVASWHDQATDTRYVLTVVDRVAASLILTSRVRRAASEAESLAASAANHSRAGNYDASLLEYLRALLAGQKAVRSQVQALVLAPGSDEERIRGALVAEPVISSIRGDLRDLLGQVTVRKVEGDGQWLAPGAPPKEPFSVRVVAGADGTPLQGVAVRFVRPDLPRPPLAQAATNAEGVVVWQPDGPPPGAGSGGALLAELDLETLAPDAWVAGLPRPSARFEYVFRSRANTRFVLAITGQAGRDVQQALDQALRADGLEPAPASTVAAQAPLLAAGAELPADEALGALRRLGAALGPQTFVLGLVGKAEVQPVDEMDTQAGHLFIVYCPYELSVLDAELPAESRQVAAISGKGQGGYVGDRAEAARRAVADACAKATAQVMVVVRGKFGAAPPAP